MKTCVCSPYGEFGTQTRSSTSDDRRRLSLLIYKATRPRTSPRRATDDFSTFNADRSVRQTAPLVQQSRLPLFETRGEGAPHSTVDLRIYYYYRGVREFSVTSSNCRLHVSPELIINIK